MSLVNFLIVRDRKWLQLDESGHWFMIRVGLRLLRDWSRDWWILGSDKLLEEN